MPHDQGGNTCGHEGNRTGNKRLLTKAIVENAIRKLEKIPEPECSQFIAATKSTVSGRTVLRGSVALRPDGSVLRTADDFRRFPICSNHHRGKVSFAVLHPSLPLAPALPAAPLWLAARKIFQKAYFNLASQSCIMEPAKKSELMEVNMEYMDYLSKV